MTTDPDCQRSQNHDGAPSMIAVVQSDTFSRPRPDDRVHLSITDHTGTITNKELSYAEFERHTEEYPGALVLLPDDQSGPPFVKIDDLRPELPHQI